MIFSIVACGSNGEIGLNGVLPWEGKFHEDRAQYLRKTNRNVRVGTRGSIATFEVNRPSYLVSRNSECPLSCSGVYDWTLFSPDHILRDIQARHINRDIFVVGGVKWYESTAHFVDKIYVTRISASFSASSVLNVDHLLKNRSLTRAQKSTQDQLVTYEEWE